MEMAEGTRFWRSAHGASLVALTACLVFGWLGAGSLENGDDCVYAWAARHMLEDGSWLTYWWHRFDLSAVYPPLHFALLRLSLSAFGESELAYRLPAAIAAFFAVLITADIAYRLSKSHSAGVLAGLCLLCSTTFYVASRSVRLDMTFLVCGMAVYAAYLRAQTDSRFFWIMGICAGLGYLAKSLLIAFVLMPIVIDVLLFRRELLRRREVYAAALLFVTLAGLWHLSLWQHGQPVVPGYGQRILQGIAGDFSFGSMLRALVTAEGVAMALWAGGLGFLVYAARASSSARVLALAVPCGLTILLATSTAMPHYALALFPPMAVGAGWGLGKLFDRRPVTLPLGVCALLFVFSLQNLRLFVNPDLSPGAREIAALARETPAHEPVLFFRDYSAAFDFYLNRSTLLLTESKHAYDLYVAHPAMLDGPGIELVSPAAMLAALASPNTKVATTVFFDEDLRAYLAKLPAEQQASLERKQVGLYVLYRPRRHAAQPSGAGPANPFVSTTGH